MNRKNLNEFHATLAAYVRRHPELTFQRMSDLLRISISTISKVAIRHGIRRGANKVGYKATPELLAELEK
jgi:hypothetical protein